MHVTACDVMTGRLVLAELAHETCAEQPVADTHISTRVSNGCCGFDVNVNVAELTGRFNIDAYTPYKLMNVSRSP